MISYVYGHYIWNLEVGHRS